MEVPHLTALHKQYADRGLVVLAVNAWDETRPVLSRYLRNNQLPYRILLNGSEVAGKRYRVRSLPTNLLIDKQGRVVRRFGQFGKHDMPKLRSLIEGLL